MQSKHSLTWIPRLNKSRHGADLGESETHGPPDIDTVGVLVEASGEPEGRGKIDSEHGVSQYRVFDRQDSRNE